MDVGKGCRTTIKSEFVFSNFIYLYLCFLCLNLLLGAYRIDPCSIVANALSIPPGEYVLKNETQRN